MTDTARQLTPQNVVYRWDLDKTYLRTEFDSVRDLVRTAFEPAARKRTVPGAAVLLRELRATHPAGVSILSGSPEQMRRKLEAKLRLDGIHWDSFTLKPSLRNLLRGKVRFLRDQVSYKLSALLSARVGADIRGRQHLEYLFGDDAEADAFVYSLYGDICAGRVQNRELMAVLNAARVYPDDVPAIVRTAGRTPRSECVQRIFIHLERMSSPEMFAPFGPRVCPFFNYFQPALALVEDGLLSAEGALRVGGGLLLDQGFHPEALAHSFDQMVRRRVIGPRTATALINAMPGVRPETYAMTASGLLGFLRDVESRASSLVDPLSPDAVEIDYVALFRADRERAHAAKRRARWRPPR